MIVDRVVLTRENCGVSEFVLVTIGVFVCYLFNGFVTEAIFQIDGFSEFGFSLTFIQFVIFVLLSACHLRTMKKSCYIFRWSWSLIRLAVLNVVTMSLTNASVGHMNYPTQLVFKSCKIITVMAAGIALRGKRYKMFDFFAVLLMTVGLVCFTMADVTVSSQFPLKGVIMVTAAVITDGIVAVYQEELTQRHGVGLTELVFKIYSIGTIMLFIFLLFTGEATESAMFCWQNWSILFPLCVAFSVTGYFGLLLVLRLIETFGALPAAIVTTSRKATTIALSFFLFNKPFTGQYVWSGMLILLGIYLNAHKVQIARWCIPRRNLRWSWTLCKWWRGLTYEGERIV